MSFPSDFTACSIEMSLFVFTEKGACIKWDHCREQVEKGRLGPGHCALFPRTDVLVVPRASIYGKFSIACAFN
jgi:hypothetical protein